MKAEATEMSIDQTIKNFRRLFQGMDLDALLDNTNQSLSRSTVTGRIIGYLLDNAAGTSVTVDAVVKGYQEYVLYIEVFDTDAPEGERFRAEAFNMATVIAALRANSEKLHLDTMSRPIMWFINDVTEPARDDMHEPDNQGISMSVEKGPEFSFGYPPFSDDLRFTLKRDTPEDKRVPVRMASFSIASLIHMMMAI